MKAARSGIHLTNLNAATAKGMIARGDRQHDIAAYFGVNGGRIGEISSGATFAGITAQTTDFPPPGPYLTPVSMKAMQTKLRSACSILEKALAGTVNASEAKVALGEMQSALKELDKK